MEEDIDPGGAPPNRWAAKLQRQLGVSGFERILRHRGSEARAAQKDFCPVCPDQSPQKGALLRASEYGSFLGLLFRLKDTSEHRSTRPSWCPEREAPETNKKSVAVEKLGRRFLLAAFLLLLSGLGFLVNMATLPLHHHPRRLAYLRRACISWGLCHQPRTDYAAGHIQLPRNHLPGIRTGGSIFGYMKLKLTCPAAPGYTPNTFWGPTTVSHNYSSSEFEQGSSPVLLIGILSSCRSRELRGVVRDTWLRISAPPGTWMARFIISAECKSDLADEQALHSDIQFVDVRDSYFTLTRKTLQFLDFAHTVGAGYTMKTDDDSYVFPDRLLQELGRLPGNCLYWGQANWLPNARKYKGSVLAVPLHKWYIPRADYMKMLEKTMYMQGGGYILSRDLVARVAARAEEPPEYLPEDAIVARLLGQDVVDRCMCSDTRLIKEAYNFQAIDLLGNSTSDCEVSDIAHRTLNVHGIHHFQDMRRFHRAALEPHLKCNETGLVFAGAEYQQLWGKDHLPRQTRGEGVGPSFALQARLWKLLQMKRHRTYDRELAPLAILAGNKDLHSRLPWCVRMHWASQIISQLRQLAEENTLICNLVASNLFINATTLDVWIDHGEVRLNYTDEVRLLGGKMCFADELCQSCFLQASRDFLRDGRCDMERRRCVGYDGVSQAQVMAQKILRPLFDRRSFPASPKRKFLSQVHAALDLVFISRSSRDLRSQDWVVDRLHDSFQSLNSIYGKRMELCMNGSREPLLQMLSEVVSAQPKSDHPEAFANEDAHDVEETLGGDAGTQVEDLDTLLDPSNKDEER